MIVDLKREDFISLIKGQTPSFEMMENSLVDKNGNYSGSYGTWTWNYDAFLDFNITNEQLFELYKLLKEK